MQSVKAYLGDRRFDATSASARPYPSAGPIAVVVEQMPATGGRPGPPVASGVVIGRPVHFTNVRGGSDDELALARLLEAVERCGFEEALFEYEPVAAAYRYERRPMRDEVILIGDFAGGTGGFSILRVGRTCGTGRLAD